MIAIDVVIEILHISSQFISEYYEEECEEHYSLNKHTYQTDLREDNKQMVSPQNNRKYNYDTKTPFSFLF